MSLGNMLVMRTSLKRESILHGLYFYQYSGKHLAFVEW